MQRATDKQQESKKNKKAGRQAGGWGKDTDPSKAPHVVDARVPEVVPLGALADVLGRHASNQ